LANRGFSEEQTVVLEHIRNCNHKGSDVKLDTQTLMEPDAWPRRTLDPKLWKWQHVVSFRWARRGHINELECRAYLAALLWRLRRQANIGTRFLHLLDSMVTLGVVSKKRSSSKKLNHVGRQIAALELAGFLWPFLGYVRSDLNPSDEPSRKQMNLRSRLPKAGPSSSESWRPNAL
jgi:hypothetical protein